MPIETIKEHNVQDFQLCNSLQYLLQRMYLNLVDNECIRTKL